MASSFIGGALSGFADKYKKRKRGGGDQKETNSGGGGASDSGGGGEMSGAPAGSFKRGGKVRRTGKARVHKGERVLTAKQAKRYEKRGAKRG